MILKFMKEIEHRVNCAIDATMSVIEGRWKGTILCMLFKNGKMRFSELQKDIG
ncbi:MAG: winged helix-turn-helix transcriptional regulator, partial [Candidatus Methanomethylophilaceae archaeon]